MRSLVIGGGGFVGGYLVDHLINNLNWTVGVTKLREEEIKNQNCKIYDMNILNQEEVIEVLKDFNPDCIFYLVAQSSVSVSWLKPKLTVDVNINGCINLLESIKNLKINPRVLLVGSAEEYGKINNNTGEVSELQNISPCNIYAATKTCQNMIGKIYSDAYNMDIIMVRAFNHFGPKQAPTFVVADFCKQVAEIECRQKEPVIKVGNLSVARDFTDVRDIVRAYSCLINKGKTGETYNVGSSRAVKISYILDLILKNSKANILVKIDESKFRPIDVPVVKADITKIKLQTGWAPEIDIETTIRDTLNYWREIIKA